MRAAPPPTPAPSDGGNSLGSPIHLTPISTLPAGQEEGRLLSAAYDAHDLLINHLPPGINVPWTNVISIGGQSGGKSSVQSAICRVPLDTANRTATHGPTQIHSRHRPQGCFSACIKITNVEYGTGTSQAKSFTASPITSKTGLAEILQMAGDEARRWSDCTDGIRTYETLCQMTAAERVLGRDQWPRFTKNVVSLEVSGPGQPDVSIVDLPGLTGSGMNGEVVESLVEEYIKRPEGIVLCCVAAGGADPASSAGRVFEVVRKHDPKGERTIGIITKADLIPDATDSDFGDLITRCNSDFVDWSPAHGWWPLRLKPYDKHKSNASDEVVMAREGHLFARPTWQKLQQQAGRSFGVTEMRAKVLAIHAARVTQNVGQLEDLLRTQTSECEKALTELPPMEPEPVCAVHNLILEVSSEIRSSINDLNHHSTKLYDIQEDLGTEIQDTFTNFIPLCEEHEGHFETYEAPVIDIGLVPRATKGYVYIDEVHQAVLKHTHLRLGSCDLAAVRCQYLKPYTERWRVISEAHVESAWAAVNVAVAEVVQGVCGTRHRLSHNMSRILNDEQQTYKKLTLTVIGLICDREQDDPELIGIRGDRKDRLYREQVRHYETHFEKCYGVEAANMRPAAPTWSEEERKHCFQTMASVSVNALHGGLRVLEIVGRETHGQIQKYLDTVVPSLRKGLKLEEVRQTVINQLSSLVEQDAAVVGERNRWLKRKRGLADVGAKFRSVSSV